MNLYITADTVGTPTGGGIVTYHEFSALRSLDISGIKLLSRNTLKDFPSEPFEQDSLFSRKIDDLRLENSDSEVKLAHGYSGCLSQTMEDLVNMGAKTTYMAAAHDVEESRKEHLLLGIPYDYPHLNDPKLWKRYLEGYLLADILIVPSTHSKRVMEKYGRTKRIEIIHHGVDIQEEVTLPPKKFTVGYLGAIGPDKGIIYLLQAWNELNYKDAELVFAGSQSQSEFLKNMISFFCKKNPETVKCLGWVNNISDFYNNISLYVQASISEGYGIEVNEAYAHGRPVICSTGAGASDVVPEVCKFQPRDYEELSHKINIAKSIIQYQADLQWFQGWQSHVKEITWEKIQEKYIKVWKYLITN